MNIFKRKQVMNLIKNRFQFFKSLLSKYDIKFSKEHCQFSYTDLFNYIKNHRMNNFNQIAKLEEMSEHIIKSNIYSYPLISYEKLSYYFGFDKYNNPIYVRNLSLEKLLKSHSIFTVNSLLQLLNKLVCHQLNSFEINNKLFTSCESLVQINQDIKSVKNLHLILDYGMTDTSTFYKLAIQALKSNCNSLIHLRINSGSHFNNFKGVADTVYLPQYPKLKYYNPKKMSVKSNAKKLDNVIRKSKAKDKSIA